MKNIFDTIFKGFWYNFALILGTGLLSLVYQGLGFITAFLYFVGWIIYKQTRKDD